MKTSVLAFCFTLLALSGVRAQDLAIVAATKPTISVANPPSEDREPSFEGGQIALREFVNTHLTYPELARMNGAEGKAAVRFLVAPDGKASRIKVLRSPGYDCEKSLIELIQKMPNWSPAFRNGTPQGGWVLLEVAFRLQ
jgi:periplasmic protein TonB